MRRCINFSWVYRCAEWRGITGFTIVLKKNPLALGAGKAGCHKPKHFPLPCHTLAFLSSGSHEPQPYGLPCHSI